MGRAPCCDKSNVKRGPWSPDEDAKLKSFIEQNGTGGNWIALPQKIGLKRCGKSCRLRWLNYLRPNIKHGGFSEEEDSIICSLYIAIGSRWSIIAAQLPGRTDNDIKNYWNTRLKKKLLGKQRKEHHHQSRRALGDPNQEFKTVLEEGTPLMVANDGDRSSYWPEPAYMTKPVETHISDHHASIRKLLIKLGGRFSSDDRADDHAIYNNCMNPVIPLVDANSFVEACSSMSGHMAEGPTCFPSELDDVFYFNSTRLEGLDCFYGGGGMINESAPTGAPETLSWSEEYCPLLYPPPASALSQAMQQQYLSGAPVHLEAQ